MNRPASWSPIVRKEIAGLLPLWVPCIAALLAAFNRPDALVRKAAIAAYIVGPLAIGAHAVGQEYLFRTLEAMLSQPVARRRLYSTKLFVAGVMIATLAGLASVVLVREKHAPGLWQHMTVQVLPVLGGLGPAPWFAMLCHSTLAGILFSASVAALTLIGSVVFTSWWTGAHPATAQAVVVGPWSVAMMACCVAGGVLSARRFMTLEVFATSPLALNLPRWFARTKRPARYRPIAALIGKELHLQQLTVVLAAVFAALSVVLSIVRRSIPGWSDAPVEVLTVIYCGALAILIGALASAEERQHGTLEWHLLQPTPAWQQWLVKVVVAFGLAVSFGAAMPALLIQLDGVHGVRVGADGAITVVLVTAGTLYISSLVGSGIHAMVLSVPVSIAALLMLQAIAPSSLPFGFVAAAALLLIRLAFANHVSRDRPWRRVALQAMMLAAVVALGATWQAL